MNQEYIRRKIVQYSKELAETTDYKEIKRLRRIITNLKKLYEPTDPTSLTDLITGK
jgi:ribosomal protein S18